MYCVSCAVASVKVSDALFLRLVLRPQIYGAAVARFESVHDEFQYQMLGVLGRSGRIDPRSFPWRVDARHLAAYPNVFRAQIVFDFGTDVLEKDVAR